MSRWYSLRPFSRHSLVLTVGGLSYVCNGVSFLVLEDMSVRRQNALYVALNMFTYETWGFVFIAVGLLAILSSRWPSVFKSWGYVVLCGLASGWAAVYYLGYILGFSPLSNISYGTVWALNAFLWLAISGLSDTVPTLGDERHGAS